MDALNPDEPPQKLGLLWRFLCLIAGVDCELLERCPHHDRDCVRASALLFLAVWCYETLVLTLVASAAFTTDGLVHFEFTPGAAAISTFALLIDSYVFGRSAYYADGLYELRKGGMDLGGGLLASAKAVLFLLIRVLFLALPTALLTGLFLGLVIFHADIAADQERHLQDDNKAFYVKAREHVDAEIEQARTAEAASAQEVATLQKQVTALRNNAVDATSGDPAIVAAQDELRQLITEKARRDQELEAAQKFAAAELAGDKVENGNSGKPGVGPVRIAALERLDAAKANVATADETVAAARKRRGADLDRTKHPGRPSHEIADRTAKKSEADVSPDIAGDG